MCFPLKKTFKKSVRETLECLKHVEVQSFSESSSVTDLFDVHRPLGQ